MRGTKHWIWPIVAAVGIAIVGVAVAANRGDDRDDWIKRSVCIQSKQQYARYVVVRDAYERGELGSRREVMRSVDPRARGAIFRPDGHLRAWSGMSRQGAHEFLQWATTGAVYRKTEAAQTRATDAITREDCEE